MPSTSPEFSSGGNKPSTADGSPVGNDSDVGVIASILPPEQSPTHRLDHLQ